MQSFHFIFFSSPLPFLTTIRRCAWFADPVLYLEVKTHAFHMKLSHGWWVLAGFSTSKARTYPLRLIAHFVTFYKTLTLLNFTTRDDSPAVTLIQCGRVLPASLSIAPALCCSWTRSCSSQEFPWDLIWQEQRKLVGLVEVRSQLLVLWRDADQKMTLPSTWFASQFRSPSTFSYSSCIAHFPGDVRNNWASQPSQHWLKYYIEGREHVHHHEV